MDNESPLITGIDMSKRYKAVVRMIDGMDIPVYSTRKHPASHYGLQVWCDKDGNAYGQINLRHPIYVVHSVEEISDEEGERFDAE